MSNMNISVILPSYKPDEKLLSTVIGLEAAGFDDIIVVDDGGGEAYNHFFDEVRKRENCTVLVHPQNRGKGAAMKTAFKWYLENRQGGGVITVDGDGQHKPEDVKACVEEMERTGNIVLGVRDFKEADIPARSRFGNWCTCTVFKLFVGLKITDTQTGLRAIPARYLNDMIWVDGDRYEYETNQLLTMKQKRMAYSEVKIETVYINENETSHFRPIRDSVKIYVLIFRFLLTQPFMKFLGSSMVCYALDWVLFTLLHMWLIGVWGEGNPLTSAIPTVSARLVTSLINFFINRYIFNNGGGKLFFSMLKYYALAVCILAASTLMVYFSSMGLNAIPWVAENMNEVWIQPLIKPFVDLILYFVSYNIQKTVVFNRIKKGGRD